MCHFHLLLVIDAILIARAMLCATERSRLFVNAIHWALRTNLISAALEQPNGWEQSLS